MTLSQTEAGKRSRGLFFTVPLVIVGSIAVSLNLASPAQAAAPAKRLDRAKEGTAELPRLDRVGARAAVVAQPASAGVARPASGRLNAAVAVPGQYTVAQGDTISAIASRFGLATARVLALNGLSWSSLIFPGQVLTLADAAPAAAAPAPVAAQAGGSYTVASGDTISGIAHAHGLSTRAVLSANGLAASSVIFPGQRIIIPTGAAAPSAAPAVAAAPVSAAVPAVSVVPFTAEMRANASVIVAVGRREHVPDYGIVIALAAAMQESGLRNLDYGDEDSLGLFQQRPSTGWGPAAQILDPAFAALAFFGGPNNPNRGHTLGLLDIPGWQSMSVTQAAQAVQISAYPDAYAAWESTARAWLASIG